jgi:predicted TPR repeat methyltransferase
LGYGNIWQATQKLSIEHSTIPQSGRVLDAGCGSGLLRNYIDIKDAKLFGFDLSEDMLQVAKATGAYSDLRPHDLFNAVPYENEFFETIYCMGVLGYINTSKPIAEFQRCLKPRGFLVIAMREEHFEEYGYPAFLAAPDCALDVVNKINGIHPFPNDPNFHHMYTICVFQKKGD